MKPCDKCPWLSKDERDIKALTPEVKQAAASGTMFICHVRMGECDGAKLYCKKQQRKEKHQ